MFLGYLTIEEIPLFRKRTVFLPLAEVYGRSYQAESVRQETGLIEFSEASLPGDKKITPEKQKILPD